MIVIMCVVVIVVVVVDMTVIVVMMAKGGQSQESLSQNGQTQHGDEQPRCQTQPGIELFRKDGPRREEDEQPQRDHPRGVRDGDRQPEEEGVTGRTPAANEIGADHGLAVAG